MTLPKFLLAWSDFNWLGFYSKLLPARDAHWSVTRVLLLTAMKAAGGALFGLVLALLIFRQPVGWLPWLLGLFAGCVGLCWFSVTAICWNQRAARLRANPALPTGLPPTRYHFFRWCLGFVYLAILGVITPFALFITVENVRGEIAWKRERAKLVAQGEKLTFREILGPEIPSDQNAGAAPVFAPLFDYLYNTGLVWPQSNAIARIENALKLPDALLPKKAGKGKPTTPAVNLEDWSAAFRSIGTNPRKFDVPWAKDLTLPPSATPAQVVLLGTAGAEPVLAEMVRASALPRSQFPIHYGEDFDMVLRHLSVLRSAQRVLQIRCAAHLAAGDTNAAFADATNALSIAELLREEPLLISQLVRYAETHVAIGTLWQGLAEHRWSDVELEEFQRRLGQVDYLPGLLLAFEGERAGGIGFMERLIDSGQHRDEVFGSSKISAALATMSRGILRKNQVALAGCESAWLAELRQEISKTPQSGLKALIHPDDAAFQKYVPTKHSPYTVILNMIVPAAGKVPEKTARAQTLVKAATVACALERYHLAHGEFPESLDQLSPQFIATVPLDPMVNRPLHYQRTDDGWFLLYSVGLNGQEDGGVMRLKRTDKEDKDWVWPVPTRPRPVQWF